MADLTGKKIALIVNSSGVEQPELSVPWEGLRAAGADMVLLAPVLGTVEAFTDDVDKTDIRNAGGTWVDDEAFTCPANEWTLVTSRNPDDLDAFVEAATDAFA